jgi:hypothetical protein
MYSSSLRGIRGLFYISYEEYFFRGRYLCLPPLEIQNWAVQSSSCVVAKPPLQTLVIACVSRRLETDSFLDIMTRIMPILDCVLALHKCYTKVTPPAARPCSSVTQVSHCLRRDSVQVVHACHTCAQVVPPWPRMSMATTWYCSVERFATCITGGALRKG